MNKIGFDTETVSQEVQTGYTEDAYIEDEWGWGEYFFKIFTGFFLVYGMFATVRDLIGLLL